jgi:hypothetical protein
VEPSAEVVPDRDPELAAGLAEAEEGIATVTTEVGSGATADMALGHLAADVVLRAVGVQRDLGRGSDQGHTRSRVDAAGADDGTLAFAGVVPK